MTSPTPGSKGLGITHRRNRSGSEGVQGSARYVDYLERQVADLLAQLQGYTSPSSGTSHASKMRRLSTEARNLRTEINDWEAKFNLRVQDEVAIRAAQDITLRGKIHALEERLEDAQERCRYAEEELEDARERLKDMKGLEEENRALEFRIETLSSLLAESTRMQTVSAPVRRSRSVGSRVTMPVESRRGSREVIPHGGSPGGVSDYGISDPIDHVLSTMAMLCGPESGAAPLTPISPLPDGHSIRSRRMRRFPSGSSAPKTLILPSAAVVPSSTSSPILPTIRTFFGTSVADPSSMCASTRPSSAGSTTAITRPIIASSGSGNSLFAELARAENSCVSDIDDVSVGAHTPAPPSPALSDTFTLVTEAIANPTPLIMRALSGVGKGIVSPSGTFLSARKKAVAVLTGVVGSGIDRVTRRRGKQFKEARRRKEDVVEERLRVKCDCTCPHVRTASMGVLSLSRKPGQEDDAVENVWLWVRFVVAIVVALGVAVREGPAVVLGDGEEFDSVGEEEREVAIRALGGRVYGISSISVGADVEVREETRAERTRREWKGMGDERLRLWERERARSGSGGGVHVGEGRRKGMEWGV